ncbi:MAG: biotin--[acetyl-CoA-carboxylase] ligase [Treponema sp.]|nr:biotin--[acetyl-CoA-carboxylase] ligase [Treponema sp.]
MNTLQITNPFGAPVYHEETVASTMDTARSLAAAGAAHGTVITADFQTAGRGRIRGRPWLMDKKINLAFTIILRYNGAEAIPPALTLRAGLALAEAIEDFAPALAGRVLIKWPNDIMLDSKKAAGILTEADGAAVFIGIGVNVAQKQFADELREKAASLSLALQRDICAEERFVLLEIFLGKFYRELKGADWKSRLSGRLYKMGEPVIFAEGAAGCGTEFHGRLAGIGDGGELLIEGEGGARSFVTGELRF